MNMATIQLSLSSIRNKRTGRAQVMMRLYHGQFNQRAKTGIYGQPELWDENRQRFKEFNGYVNTGKGHILSSDEVHSWNTQLDTIEEKVSIAFQETLKQRQDYPEKWLQATVWSICDEADDKTTNGKKNPPSKRREMKSGMKIYISGKISGKEPEARNEFLSAEHALLEAGHQPVNPFRNGLTEDDTWERHLAVDIIDLLGCDAIMQLPGWEDSRGARLEAEIAKRRDIPKYVDDELVDWYEGDLRFLRVLLQEKISNALGLSARLVNILSKHGYDTVVDLFRTERKTVMGLPGLGKKSREELGLCLDMLTDKFPALTFRMDTERIGIKRTK